MGIDQVVRHYILEDPDISISALTIAVNRKHGTVQTSHSTNYTMTHVKYVARRVRHQLSKHMNLQGSNQ